MPPNDGTQPVKAGQAEAHAREFLPAALEIVETPASPLGRIVALSLAAFFTIAVVWAVLGKVDVVAVAQGRIVPEGGVKTIQPLEIGKVRTIHVRDGDRVSAGDVLIELDPTESEVDVDQLRRELLELDLVLRRLGAHLRGLDGRPPEFEPTEGAEPRLVRMHEAQLEADQRAFQSRLATIEADISRRLAEIDSIKAEIGKYTQILPLNKEREADLYELLQRGNTEQLRWMEAKEQLIDTQENINIARHRLRESESGLEAAFKQMEDAKAEAQQEALAEMVESNRRVDEIRLALKKAAQRERFTRLVAPVDGVVQQLAVKTEGGVVTPAEPVMAVVPADAMLEIEATVLNKDKGFVEPGQAAEIKVETFLFTKYGTIDGEVLDIADDAVEEENVGLVYPIRVALAETQMQVEGRPVPLTSGMNVTVEIKTGRRRIIEFLLSPLKKYGDEAIQER